MSLAKRRSGRELRPSLEESRVPRTYLALLNQVSGK
jgi:hypothetical protein